MAACHDDRAVESDPHAEPSYLHAGAVRIGEAASSVFVGRVLPLLTLAVHNLSAA